MRHLLAGAAAVAVALAVGAPSAGAGSGSTRTVTLKHIAFTPGKLTIHVGQRVKWKWDDGPYVEHNLHSVGSPRFKGASGRRTGTHTVRFTRRGTYRYQCTLHPGMTGRIVVR